MRIQRQIAAAATLVTLLLPGPEGMARRRVQTPSSQQFARKWDKQRFSHRLLTILLRRHVRLGRVDYPGINRYSKALLSEYLYRIANTPLGGLKDGKAARLAFLINAHNAISLRAVLQAQPPVREGSRRFTIASLRRLRQDRQYQVGGSWLSLDQLRQRIVRLQDCRAHFALVDGTRGGPGLQRRAFIGRTLGQRLVRATRWFLRDRSRGFRYDARTGTVYLSPIFKWYQQDFRRPPHGHELDFVAAHLRDRQVARTLREKKRILKIRYVSYDRTLNQR